MKNMISRRILLLLFIIVALVASCHPNEDNTTERARKAKKATGDIEIAIIWSPSVYKDMFMNGIHLAKEEINRRGGVLGRKIRLIEYDELASFTRAMDFARDIAGNTDIVAVIGHQESLNAISASTVYQYNGVLFISPRATSAVLTEHGFDLVFRTMPATTEMGIQMCQLAYKKGFRRMVVVDDQGIYGKELADAFYECANDIGINIVSRRYYFPWEETYYPLLAEIRRQPFDAIFLAGGQPYASIFIKQARKMGVKAPFMAGHSLDSPRLWSIAGSASEGTIVPSVFDPFSSNPVNRRFVDNFHLRYGIDPDTSAAQGYDALSLLAYAFEESKTTIPVAVASTLRFVQNWNGVTGLYTFKVKGDLVDKKMFFKVMHNGTFEFLQEDVNIQKAD
ncbi:MAG: ABC transporter substrate-binding protein [Nitrospirae bacterium]|nr:ABC transporter substrate-binding protein [Nitrospirota bacterium]